jgi:hypothetical protein
VDLRDALADPRARLGLGVAGLLATAGAVHRDRVGACEARTFRAVNSLPDALYPPAWIVMQMGAFGAVPASAFTAWRAGDAELAAHLPLDIAGGVALGLAADAAAVMVTSRPGRDAGLGRRAAPAA